MLCALRRAKLLSGLQLDCKLSLHTIKAQADNLIQMSAHTMIGSTTAAAAARK